VLVVDPLGGVSDEKVGIFPPEDVP